MEKDNKKPLKLIIDNKTHYFADFILIFLLTFAFLYLVGLVPQEFKNIIGREPVKESKGNLVGELPISIEIPMIGVDAPIYNPATTSLQVLNDYLLKGAVRYPGSGLLGGEGNIFIFGHFYIFHNICFFNCYIINYCFIIIIFFI